MLKIQKQRGITLISLVITIIVLIILASVAIYLSLGNNGIFIRAKEAKEKTNKQEATDIINLKITTAQMNKYVEKQEMPSLQELADVLYDDNEIQYVALESKVADKEKVIVGEKTSIYTKLNNYPYEFEINSSLQLASINGIKLSTVPSNDDDTIVSMTKAELQSLIDTSINSKMNNYSTSEKRIGTWIDGKPLYQKTIECNYGNNGTPATDYVYSENSGIYDMVMVVSAMGTNSNGGTAYGNVLGGVVRTNDSDKVGVYYSMSIQAIVSDGNLSINFGHGTNRTDVKPIVTIQYTKTSDTAPTE